MDATGIGHTGSGTETSGTDEKPGAPPARGADTLLAYDTTPIGAAMLAGPRALDVGRACAATAPAALPLPATTPGTAAPAPGTGADTNMGAVVGLR